MLSLRRLLHSFRDAKNGLSFTFKNEQNFRIQILISFLVLVAAFVFPIKIWEIILLVMLIVFVLVMELLNTAIENFADLLKPRLHHYVSVIKDVMAAAVLLTAIGSAIIGVIIFLPHFINLFE